MGNIYVRCKVCSQAMFVVQVSVLSAGLNILFGKHIKDPTMYVEPHVCPTRVSWPPESSNSKPERPPGVLVEK